MKCLTFAICALYLSASATPLIENGLQAYWNAVSKSGMVTADSKEQSHEVTYVNEWTSSGACTVMLGATTNNVSCPYYFTNAFVRADGSYAEAVRMNWRPYAEKWDASWRFQQLYTAPGVKTDFNLGKEMTWFFVANLKQNFQGQGGALWGFTYGEDPDIAPTRIGVFSPGADGSVLRLYAMNGSVGSAGNVSTPEFGTPFLMDARLNGAKVMTAGLNGAPAIQPVFGQTPTTANPARFEIGAHYDMMNPKVRPSMDIGALVIYSRALNDAERVIVRESLAAEFGISLGSAAIYEGGSEAKGHWLYDLIGIGSSTDSSAGAMPGVAAMSGWSADMLRMEVVSGLDGNGDYLFAARQSADGPDWTFDYQRKAYRLVRGWRIERHGLTHGKVRISLRGPGGNVAFRGVLLAKPAGALDYSEVGASSTFDMTTGVQSFEVSDEVLTTGTLLSVLRLTGGGRTPVMPNVCFEAGMGVTVDANDIVGKWENQGSLGADIDVLSYSGKVTRVTGGLVRSDGSVRDVIRFPGYAYLRSAVASSLGIGGSVSWFVAMKPTQVGGSLGHPVFGLEWNGRFGAFLPGSLSVVKCYPGASTASIDLNSVSAGVWSLADIRCGTDKVMSGAIDDGAATTGTAATVPAPSKQCFAIGNAFAIADWERVNPPFVGDIAEVRVYNSSLDDVERLRVRQEIMSRYGFAPSANSRFASAEPGAQGYEYDMAVVGSLSDGHAAEVVEDCSGGLGVVAVAGPGGIIVGDTLVFAHNGLGGWSGSGADVKKGFVTNRLARVWRIVPSGSAGIAARLSFPVPDLVGRERKYNKWRLLYRDIAAAKFDVLESEAAVSAGVVSFSLSAESVASGLYTVGLQRDDKGIVLVIR